jgi:hypothetical protein
MDELISEWKSSYADCFSNALTECKNKNARDVCTCLSANYKDWFEVRVIAMLGFSVINTYIHSFHCCLTFV